MPDVEETLAPALALAGLTQKLTLWNIAYVLVIIVATVVVSRMVLALAGRALSRGNLDPALVRIVKNMLRFAVGVVCVLLICETLGVEITSLIALFSVVGLALSLAVQGVLANLAGGIVLLGARLFRAGDFVEIGGVKGTVKEMTLMYTKLTTTDNRLVSLPNKTVSETTVQNFSHEATRRIELTFTASYDSPIDDVKAAVLAMLAADPLVLDTPEPVVGVAGYGASAIEYNVWAWCSGASYWPAFYSVNEGLKKALEEKGLEMTYDHINVHMIDPDRG